MPLFDCCDRNSYGRPKLRSFYEQGSYFVFDIIESAEATPTKGRLAIPAEALAMLPRQRARRL